MSNNFVGLFLIITKFFSITVFKLQEYYITIAICRRVDFTSYFGLSFTLLDSNLVNNTDLTLLRFMYFTLTASKLWLCSYGVPRLVSPFWHALFSILGH